MKGNSLISQCKTYLKQNPTEIVFGLYFFAVMSASVLMTGGGILFKTLTLYAAITLTPLLHKFVVKINFSSPSDVSKKTKIKVFAIAGGTAFAVLLLCYAANYPGAFSPDSINQYSQAIRGSYNDWHPTWHTLLFFTFPLKLTGGWAGSIILFQMIYFSLFMGIFSLTVYLYAGAFYAFFSMLLLLLSPFTLEILMYPWKDTAFAIASGFCMLFAVHIYFTKGEWSKKVYRLVIFAFLLASATLFRHNGILFTFFLAMALIFFMQKKQWVLLIAMTIILLVCVKIPVYSFLKVGKPARRTQETMGFPLSVIINVAKERPDKLDDTTANFVQNLTKNQPNWKKFHNISGFNSIKWTEGRPNNDAIKKAGVAGILRMMCRCFTVAPKQAKQAAVGLTIHVYGLEIACRAPFRIANNNLKLTDKGIKPLKLLVQHYISFISKSSLRYVFQCIGSTILAMLAFILFKSNFRSWSDWKRIFLCIPIFTYNFGTMLLLSGRDVRFFYVSFLVCPLVILILCGKQAESPQ